MNVRKIIDVIVAETFYDVLIVNFQLITSCSRNLGIKCSVSYKCYFHFSGVVIEIKVKY